MSPQIDAYTTRQVGTTGHEIFNPDGSVIAWAVDAATAQALVALLNLAQAGGLLNLSHDNK